MQSFLNFVMSIRIQGVYWQSAGNASSLLYGDNDYKWRHAPPTECMAVMGIPVMTKKTSMDAEKWVDEWWTLLEESMKEAVKLKGHSLSSE